VPPRRARGRRGGALAGVVVGVAILAVVVWAVAGRGAGDAPATTATAPAPPPPPPILRIVFPEGFTRKQMAERITAVDEIAADKRRIVPALAEKTYLIASRTKNTPLPRGFHAAKARTLEGFLFPALYEFTPDTRSRQLVEKQLAAFADAWRKVDLRYAKSKNLTPYDVLIIASMIEREVRVPRERRLVAAVIYNRLHLRMPLGIDATIRYGLDIPPTAAIRQSQLDSKNPYNTRNRQGLPPTPISNPGLASMQAAAHPAHVPYVYFVRKPDCRSHFFTKSERAFHAYANRGGLDC
jgi:UPF0755 protein